MPVREDQSTIKGQTSDILNFAAKLVRLNIRKSCYMSLLTNETPRHTSYILIFHENLTILSFYKYLSGKEALQVSIKTKLFRKIIRRR